MAADAKAIYKDRAATAETTNANLRQQRGLNQLLVRGLPEVTTIAMLAAFTYNALLAIKSGLLV